MLWTYVEMSVGYLDFATHRFRSTRIDTVRVMILHEYLTALTFPEINRLKKKIRFNFVYFL